MLANALARVPKPDAPDALPRVGNVDAKLDGPEPHLKVEALFDPKGDRDGSLHRGGESVRAGAEVARAGCRGQAAFRGAFGSAKEAEALKGKSLTLTLVSDQGSTETAWTAE